jgi:hypothetical protein
VENLLSRLASAQALFGSEARSFLPVSFDRDQSLDPRSSHDATVDQRRRSMLPMEMIVLALIVTAFCAFAATLYWADLQTRGVGK